ncbi:Urease accessory protein UreF [Paraconexibacter sp. AEG42_29]|uniref:Urease accessory protein UreF n=1 Tax=Paraconexibacter sp. AEG42_29 TaxID=2997339 RepID=A0AAU7B145_9ACTN
MLNPIMLLLSDARTPTGSYAHSAGLEAAVQSGLRPDEVPAFMRGRLRTVAVTEAALSAAAVLASGDLDLLLALDDEAVARCPSPALRTAATTLGRGLLRTGAQLFPDAGIVPAYRAASSHTPRCVALGVVAGAGGLTSEQAALIALHDDAATVAAAAVKLLPVDAGDAAGWIARLAPQLQEAAALAVAAALRDDLPSLSAPLVERRSLRHTTDRGRLFAS